MLVLTRQTEESIIIGDDVEIVVVAVSGNRVRLGINAPRSISVHRKEVYEAIQEKKRRGVKIHSEHRAHAEKKEHDKNKQHNMHSRAAG
jgi:carbon storage regulator